MTTLDLGDYAARRAVSDLIDYRLARSVALRQLQFAALACHSGYAARVVQHIAFYQAESLKATRSWRKYLYYSAQSERCKRRGWRRLNQPVALAANV